MNVLIIDDEKPARDEMRLLLAEYPDVKVAGEAFSVASACEAVVAQMPDVIFLDINLRGSSGFEVLERLPLPHPHVVFCTAYDEHALRAFEVSAIDYLLKPVHSDRLARALGKIRQSHCAAPFATVAEPLLLSPHSRVFVREGDRCWFVVVQDIHLIEAEGNYSRLHFGQERALIFRSLNSLEARLPAEIFVRANRSQIVNTSCIVKVVQWFSQSLRLTIRTGEEIVLSRRASLAFREGRGL